MMGSCAGIGWVSVMMGEGVAGVSGAASAERRRKAAPVKSCQASVSSGRVKVTAFSDGRPLAVIQNRTRPRVALVIGMPLARNGAPLLTAHLSASAGVAKRERRAIRRASRLWWRR